MRYGIVADTHDRVLPSLFEVLAGVQEILHAGDVCTADTLIELETIAPVTAVHGNMDKAELARRLPAERALEREGVAIQLLHGHRTGSGTLDRLAAALSGAAAAGGTPDAAAGRSRLVISGHTHEPHDAMRSGIRFFNPGTAGGVGRSPSVGILTIEDGRFDLRHVPLPR